MTKSCFAAMTLGRLTALVSFLDGVKLCSRVSVSRAAASSETKAEIGCGLPQLKRPPTTCSEFVISPKPPPPGLELVIFFRKHQSKKKKF